ncbi:hypothetical protein HBH50_074400 [Parastagonospora nodorum]|nr:hypothetical protein HBH50_074400 [Parastagonospora nodorum]KAH5681681.1 hypothetical protein HBI21_056560 [Parastagonospora nodorum]KAH5701065.1 hypothetical protein HBI44_046360 [Parastagonospora nodorum]KAH5923553.1 hypothetical protein HBI86_234410 [Parastagonospora nodorum]KAH5995691.1 hypothetical protein HBI83_239170 [Parastagonospora nodorum]
MSIGGATEDADREWEKTFLKSIFNRSHLSSTQLDFWQHYEHSTIDMSLPRPHDSIEERFVKRPQLFIGTTPSFCHFNGRPNRFLEGLAILTLIRAPVFVFVMLRPIRCSWNGHSAVERIPVDLRLSAALEASCSIMVRFSRTTAIWARPSPSE